jgi:2-amino-4-hydroxy-6-hydroxymethyldihydropteridine diphosphokinase
VILIGIGGNLGNPRFGSPRNTLSAALAALEVEGASIATRSGWYRSEPVPRSDQPWFINAVASLASQLGANELLGVLQAIETRFGRLRGERNAARTLDLDLLDHNGQMIETSSLVLPHPRLHERRFVLVPLVEIAPNWLHPRLGLTAAQLLAKLTTEQQLERLPCEPDAGLVDCPRSTSPI